MARLKVATRSRATCARVPAADIQPPHGDPSTSLEHSRSPPRIRARDADPELRGQLAGYFPELGGSRAFVPGLHGGMICKFVNASTADGYNPYRITRDGIDWEVIDPPTRGRISAIGAITRSSICSSCWRSWYQHASATLRGFSHFFPQRPLPDQTVRKLLEDPKETIISPGPRP